MNTQTTKRPTNRGELRQLLGATRNDDGSWSIPECPICHATTMQLTYHKSSGIEGDITHMRGDEVGCVMSVDKAVSERMGDALVGLTDYIPQTDKAMADSIVDPTPMADADQYASVQYIQFVHAVSFGSMGSKLSWRRSDDAGRLRIVDIGPATITIAFGNEDRLISMANVVYLSRKPRPS